MGTAYNPSIATSGLTLCVDAGNPRSYPGSGTTINDISGQGIAGTLTNGPTYSASNGGYVSFDGVNDYISLPSSSNLLTFGANPFSINFWIYLNTIGANHTILTSYSAYNSGWNSYFFLGYWTATNRLGCLNSVGTTQPAFTPMSANIWTHICITKTGSTFNLYVNGALYQTGTDASNDFSGSGRTILIGGGLGDFGHLNGRLAQLQIYNTLLTASQAQQNFNAMRGRFGL